MIRFSSQASTNHRFSDRRCVSFIGLDENRVSEPEEIGISTEKIIIFYFDCGYVLEIKTIHQNVEIFNRNGNQLSSIREFEQNYDGIFENIYGFPIKTVCGTCALDMFSEK